MPQQAIDRQARATQREIESNIDLGVRQFRALVDRLRQQVVLAVVEQGAITNPADVAAIKQATQSITEQWQARMIDKMSEDARRVFVRGILTVDKSLTAGGIRPALPYLSEQLLEQARSFQADLVTNLTDWARDKIRQEVQLASLGQKPTDQVVADIGKSLAGDKSVFASVWQRANIIYNTEMSRLANLAAAQRFEQAAKQIPDLKKKWVHSHLGTPRANHLAMDGTTVPADATFQLKGRDGNVYEVKAPHDPHLPPGEVINCKCVIVPVVGRFSGEEPAKRKRPRRPRPPVKPPPPEPAPAPVVAPTPKAPPAPGEFTHGVYDTSAIVPERFDKIVGKNALIDQFWLAFKETPARNFAYRPKSGKAYYMPNTREVNFATARLGKETVDDDKWWKKKLASHEWGHALHFDRGFVTHTHVDDEFKAVVAILREEVAALQADPNNPFQTTFTPGVYAGDYLAKARAFLGAAANDISNFQLSEYVNMTTDSMSGVTAGMYGWGHQRSYWLSSSYHKYMEIFAHLNSAINDVRGNPFMQKLFPRFYRAGIELITRLMNEWSSEGLAKQQAQAPAPTP